MLQAVILDLDGVLCHTDSLHYAAWKSLADRLGLPFDEARNNSLRGVSRRESLELLLGEKSGNYTEREKEALAEEKNEAYRALLATLTLSALPQGVRETLEALRNMGLLLAIGSSSKNTALLLRQLGLTHFFDAVADGTQITRSKPDPEVFLLAARLLSVQPREALVVEDAAAGVEAALRGGFPAAGIGPAATHPRAAYALQSFAALRPLCARLQAQPASPGACLGGDG